MGLEKTLVTILTYFVLNPILLASILVPFQAEASVFSFFSKIFTSTATQAQAQGVESNSQNMALLEAVSSPNQNATTTNTDSLIIAGTYLSSDSISPTPESKTLNDDQISIYVVHSGDTLPAIAKMFGVSVNTIRWGNDISGNTVSVGQKLVILPISGIQHIVKSGDTLQSIAKLHKGDLDEIIQYNNLSKDAKLAVGDVIIVPDGESSATPTSSSGSSSSPAVGKPGSSLPTYSGYYMRPIIGGIKTQGIHGHNGVDLASNYGANILAAADGEVIISKSSGWNGGYGDYIVIKHGNGTQTLYGHLSATLVSVGDMVIQGQVIGKMGNTGEVTGPTGIHLHFEIRGARNPF